MNLFKLLLASAATLTAATGWAVTVPPTTGDNIIQLSELEGTQHITFLSGESVRLNRSTANNPLTIEGTVYESGIGSHAPSVMVVELNGASTFHAILGVDDEADLNKDNHGIVDFTVTAYGDNINATTTIASGNLNRQTPSYHYDLDINDLSAYTYLKIEFAPGTANWADHVDIADARFTFEGTVPAIIPESDMFVDKSSIVNLPETPQIDGAQIIPLSSLEISNITNGWGTVKANKSIDGNSILMKGTRYSSGVGIHADAKIVVKLNGSTPRFHAVIGIDDEVANEVSNRRGGSNVDYRVLLRSQGGEEEERMAGTICVSDAAPVTIDLNDLGSYKYLIIEFDKAGQNECDHVDVANAYFEFLYQNSNPPEIVNEAALNPGLDAATTLFSQPGVRFMHKLRSQNPEAVISVSDLPEGLTFNEERNLVEGRINTEGVYTYNVSVNLDGETITEPVTLTVSSNLQQPTPFMGWLSWNSIEGNISETVVQTVANAMVEKGLVDAGYNYLVIDDLWHADSRAADGTPVEHPSKFPNGMKATADYVHDKGMKFGIYSDAATRTCAGAYGSLGYETIDANQYAAWGVDLLKYDYCGAPGDVASARTRYKAMGDALKASGRNIIFYVCEWGQREPWKWGAEAGGTCWRTTYDTRDCWIGATGGIGIVQSIEVLKDIWAYNGVNRWNDADMMCIGINGTGKSSSHLCATGPGMTKDEYRTQMALWCMWASPLTLSNDMTKPLSEEDLAIMTNAELIALNQDPMGQAAQTIHHDAADYLLMAKDCENGDIAISLTNLTASAKSYTIDLSRIPGIDTEATYVCRDLVKHENLADVKGSIDAGSVPSHATVVYRLTNKNGQGAIDDVVASKALDRMTVSSSGDSLNICLPGTEGTAKRVIVSNIKGQVVAHGDGTTECFTAVVPGRGIYTVNVTCAARSMTRKVIL